MATSDKRWTDGRYVWNQLDYEHDAIVEASAGTGKTFALESIVVKLIREKGYSPREILLVTFTEKAAAELKNRVREALEKEKCLPPDFDEATICTIHSFCRQLLTEFAFENGVPMQCDIGGDGKALARRAVLDTLKGPDFKALCPKGLSAALKAAGVASVGKLVEEVGKKIGRTAPDEWREELDVAVGNAVPAVRKAHAELVALGVGNVGEYVLKHVTKFAKGIPPFYTWLAKAFDSLANPDGESFKMLFPEWSGTNNPKIKSWDGTPAAQGAASVELFEVEAAKFLQSPIENLDAALKKMGKAASRKNQKELAIKLLNLAIPLFEKFKKAAALLPFDDMVARAAEVVGKEPGTPEEQDGQSRFFDAIRTHWRVALVDEFQDTDQSQWDIFRVLFSAAANRVDGRKPGFLLVVGDPKQAIYSFRGADVRVYGAAKAEILGTGGQKYSLLETFRAKPALVDAFNGLFSNGWFENGAAGADIPYDAVRYPEDGNGKFGDRKDDGGRLVHGLVHEAEPVPVRLLESIPGRMRDAPPQDGAFGKADVCLPVFMENAAREMKRLHALDPAYKMLDKDGNPEPHRFRYRDMCVLVKTNRDAASVRRVLARNGIPYGQYKQRGLFDSPEAEGVLALLDCLAKPNDAGSRAALLVSPVFGIEPALLPQFAAFPSFDAFVETLRALAAKKKWNELFEKAMSDPCTALATPGADIHAFNRVRAAVRRIFDLLLAKRGRLARTVADFSAALRAWRKDDKSAGDDGELFGKESDADRVQIMTMHAAKGLQFPVVFVAAGFSKTDAMESDPDRKRELREEARRLFYVALTRAEHRIYLPWSKNAWESGIGTDGSPLLARSKHGFLGQAIQSWFDTKEKRDAAFPAKAGATKEDGTSAAPSPAAPAGNGAGEKSAEIPDVRVPDDLKWRKGLRLQWDSFSSIHGKSEKSRNNPPPGTERIADSPNGRANRDDEPEELAALPSTGGKKSLLPPGNVCGNVFHETMEALCKNDEDDGRVGFTNAADADNEEALLDLIREKMRANAVKSSTGDDGETTEKAFLDMVRHALDVELDFGGCRFRLREIPRGDRLAETQFMASEPKLLDRHLPAGREGAFNGAIDLLVRKDGKVFIVDWKTNSLAKYDDPKEMLDRPCHVAAAMEDNGYHLQYKLYALAADAWLKGHDETLAGVAYLFVRACKQDLQDLKGDVFAVPVDEAALERFREDVAAEPAIMAEKEDAE